MVYKYHQKWRDITGSDSSVFDMCDLPLETIRNIYYGKNGNCRKFEMENFGHFPYRRGVGRRI